MFLRGAGGYSYPSSRLLKEEREVLFFFCGFDMQILAICRTVEECGFHHTANYGNIYEIKRIQIRIIKKKKKLLYIKITFLH